MKTSAGAPPKYRVTLHVHDVQPAAGVDGKVSRDTNRTGVAHFSNNLAVRHCRVGKVTRTHREEMAAGKCIEVEGFAVRAELHSVQPHGERVRASTFWADEQLGPLNHGHNARPRPDNRAATQATHGSARSQVNDNQRLGTRCAVRDEGDAAQTIDHDEQELGSPPNLSSSESERTWLDAMKSWI